MSISSRVLHITLFEYLFNLISLLNIVSLNHSLLTSAESTSTFIVACNSISSSPWNMKLLAGAGVRWIEDHWTAVRTQLYGNLFCTWETRPQRNFTPAFCLNTRSYDRPVFQTSPSLAFLVVVRTISSSRNLSRYPLVYFSFSLQLISWNQFSETLKYETDLHAKRKHVWTSKTSHLIGSRNNAIQQHSADHMSWTWFFFAFFLRNFSIPSWNKGEGH